MTSYKDLLAKAQRHQNDRYTFETKSTEKALHLHNALVEALDAPPNAVTALKLKADPDDTEVQVSDEYVLSPKGLRFGIQVLVGKAFLRSTFYIAPKGDRLILTMEGRSPIDVTDRIGVSEWCDWMERVLEERLASNLSGHISTMMAAKD